LGIASPYLISERTVSYDGDLTRYDKKMFLTGVYLLHNAMASQGKRRGVRHLFARRYTQEAGPAKIGPSHKGETDGRSSMVPAIANFSGCEPLRIK
jgi:hypothetical protein